MQYNGEANNQDIISRITYFTGLDLNSFTIKDRTLSANETFRVIWQLIFEAYGGWQFMDDNLSDTTTGVPYADQTITNNAPLYGLPAGTLTVGGIQIKNSASAWQEPLLPLTQEEFIEMGGEIRFQSSGVPIYYMMIGDVFRLLPTPNYTLAAAIRVLFEQDISTFVVGDTTKVPGFASTYHDMIPIGVALEYAQTHPGMESKVPGLTTKWSQKQAGLVSFYAKRFKQRFPTRIGAGVDLMDEFS